MSYQDLEAQLLDWMARPAGGIPEAEFDALALEIHRFQREANAPYAQFCRHEKARVKHWWEIPAVPTSAFRHAALRTFPASEAVATFRTSGTTGEGYGSHHFCSTQLYDASILRAWRDLALPSAPQIILTQRPGDAPHSSLSHMMGTFSALGPQTWAIDAGGSMDVDAIRTTASAGPVLILGTALAFLHLIETLGTDQIPLAPGSIAMETGGYKGTGRTLTKAALYEKMRGTFSLAPEAIFNEYSMTELSSQWYTRGLGGAHHGPEWTRVRVVDPESGEEAADGERGMLRLYDLANLGSVAAIQTQDLAIRRGGDFELLGRDPNAIARGCSRSADELLSR
ncbi:MAG: hypothetical protein ACFUZC_12925 [Chthoniobacteraceae bacterium]